ncbi:hypothetical protein SCUP234_06749 [Seiridium cupressi]|uniref:Uncharacterized protein n=1 Tax=Seiridium unicorne TaxID=138068 RepID=A0ABR2UIW6_9PEZI
MAQDTEPLVVDSIWLPCYVVLALIPVVFVCVATYSVWRDRRTRAKYDIEAIKVTYARYWSSSYQDHRKSSAKPRAPIPTLPVNRAGPKLHASVLPPPSPNGFTSYGSASNSKFARLLEQRPHQRPGMLEPVVPRSPAAPAWTGRDPGPGNYAGMHGGNLHPQAGGHGPWMKGTGEDYEGHFI